MWGASIGLIWKCTDAIRIVWALYSNSGLLNGTNGPHSYYSCNKIVFHQEISKDCFQKNIISFQANSLHTGLLSTTQVDQNTTDKATKWKPVEMRSCLSQSG